MMTKFDAKAVWARFTDSTKPQLSLFMAVPTVYGIDLLLPTAVAASPGSLRACPMTHAKQPS